VSSIWRRTSANGYHVRLVGTWSTGQHQRCQGMLKSVFLWKSSWGPRTFRHDLWKRATLGKIAVGFGRSKTIKSWVGITFQTKKKTRMQGGGRGGGKSNRKGEIRASSRKEVEGVGKKKKKPPKKKQRHERSWAVSAPILPPATLSIRWDIRSQCSPSALVLGIPSSGPRAKNFSTPDFCDRHNVADFRGIGLRIAAFGGS